MAKNNFSLLAVSSLLSACGLNFYLLVRAALFSNYKQLLNKVFCDIQNYQGRDKYYQSQSSASAGNTYRDLDNT